MYIHLKANNGQYVVAEGGGGDAVNANRDVPLAWETFALFDPDDGDLNSGDDVYLRSSRRLYLGAEGGGGGRLVANGTCTKPWSKFVIERVGGGSDPIASGDSIALRVFNGQYVVAEGGGGGVVNANRDAVQAWETFELIEAP